MGWESSDVVRFDLEPLLQCQMRTAKVKVLLTHLLLILEVCSVKPNCRISLAGNLLMSDLTFGPSFKAKRWFTGFGELSSRGYKFASVLRCVGLVIYCTLPAKFQQEKVYTRDFPQYQLLHFSKRKQSILTAQDSMKAIKPSRYQINTSDQTRN